MLLRPSGNQPPLPASPLLLSKVTYLNTCSEHAVTKLPGTLCCRWQGDYKDSRPVSCQVEQQTAG